MEKRERWRGRKTFIMAAVGSAIGLGNLWRFPYIAAQNGGGAFLVPFFVAIITAGIPLMILEYGLGIRYQSSAHNAMGAIRRPFRVIGWFSILGAFVINVYYCVVMAWTWRYLYDASTLSDWAQSLASTGTHFEKTVLNVSSGPGDFGDMRWSLFVGLALTWVAIWAIIKSGLGKIGKVLLFTVPFPVILILILVVRGVTLEGAAIGLNHYLTPHWDKLLDPNVWLAAYGQVFFSLSVGFGTMIAYSSFMPTDTEIPNSAAITSFANCSFSFLAGFAVFSVLGYFAWATNQPIDAVAKAGPGLAFVVYPAALAKLPFWPEFFGVMFFLTLLLLGIDSAFSLLETVSAAICDKFGFSRTRSTTIVAVISFLLGVPFVTGAGLHWLDIVDHFVLCYVITTVAVLECIAVGYFLGFRRFASEVNKCAEIKIGWTYAALILFFTPALLVVTIALSVHKELQAAYNDHPTWALLVLGVGVIAAMVVAAVLLSLARTRTDVEAEAHAEEEGSRWQ